ncbi:MAG: NUDIX domain-containing protein, partial [Spirochaetaceae bacterium]|nr:NUDIX domain-containing protein [Spirochaetaceae bacterium]
RVLLVEHRKLGIWVQPGGHADGNTNLEQTARREVTEETGIETCRCDGAILDLDIHPIPARPGEGDHHHYDVRFLFVAESDHNLIISEESTDLKWIELNEVGRFSSETSISRMISKAGVRLKG